VVRLRRLQPALGVAARRPRALPAAAEVPSTASSPSGLRTKERMLERGYDPSCGLKPAGHSHDPRGDDSGKFSLRRATAHAGGHNVLRLQSHSASRSARIDKPARAMARESPDTRELRSPTASSRARSLRASLSSPANSGARQERELGKKRRLRQLRGRFPTDHNQVDARSQRTSTCSEPFSNPALYVVTNDRVTHFATYGNPQPVCLPRSVRMSSLL